MAFQFKRDRDENIALTLTGDVDLEITPDIKSQLASQLEDARALIIDARGVSYLDSSGVSIMVIAMQSCKQKRIEFTIEAISDEAVRVLELAKLDKILPIKQITGPANSVDVDVFAQTGRSDSQLAADMASDNKPSSDDDLIAALSSGDVGTSGDMADKEAAPAVELEMTPEPEPTPAPAANPSTDDRADNAQEGGAASGDGGKFTPGTF